MEEYYYKYPADGNEAEEEYIEQLNKNIKNKKLITVIIGENLVLFLLYLMPFFGKLSSVFLFLIIAQSVFFFYFYKTKSLKLGLTMLSITAYEDRMILEYYNGRRKKVLYANYKDIVTARFSDDEYTKFQIGIAKTDSTYIEESDLLTGEKYTPNMDSLFLFSIRPFSCEQYFFLYAADKLFDIQGFDRNKRFLKQYGTASEYLEALENGE